MTPKKKRAYLAVIALAGVGWFVDRLIQPSTTLAETALLAPGVEGASSHRPGAGAATPSDTLSLSVPELPFPRGLPSWDPNQPIRDLFSPGGSNDPSDKRRAHGAGAEEGYGTCARLTKSCRLDALMVNERLQIAVINGERMQVGREVQGCKLFSVEGHQVRFRCSDGEVGITLTPSATNSGG